MDVFRNFCDEVHYFSEYGAERSDDSGAKKNFVIEMMKQFQYVLLIVLAVIPEKASSGPVLEMKII